MASLAFGFVRLAIYFLLARDRDVTVLLGPFCTRGHTPLIVSPILIKLMSLSSDALQSSQSLVYSLLSLQTQMLPHVLVC